MSRWVRASPLIRNMIKEQLDGAGINLTSDEHVVVEINPPDDYKIDRKHSALVLRNRDMNPTAEQIQKINHFSKVNIDMCAKIASVVDIKECEPKEQLLTEEIPEILWY